MEERRRKLTLSYKVSIETGKRIVCGVGIGRVNQSKMKDISLFLVDVCNQFLALGELAESTPCFWSILAGLRYKFDEAIISTRQLALLSVTDLSLASLACPSRDLNLGSRGLMREKGRVSSFP